MTGVSFPSVEKSTGHSDLQRALALAHLSTDHLAESMDKLASDPV